MTKAASGIDPVAKIEEVNGDIHMVADHLADKLGTDEFLFVSVVGGDLYLGKWSDESPYWYLDGEVSEGETGSWDSETDELAHELPEGYEIIDVMRNGRYLVSENAE